MTCLGLLAIVVLSTGATCIPLADDTRTTPIQGINLAISIETPAADIDIPPGRIVRIDWSVGNRTNQTARVSLFAESRRNLSRTALVTDLEVPGKTGFGTFEWNTTGFVDSFTIIGRVTTGDLTFEDEAEGVVRIDTPPSFRFLTPTIDETFDIGGPNLRIAWNAGNEDAGGTAEIALDPDADHNNGNEIIISRNEPLPTEAADDELQWNGNNADNTAVPVGVYRLFARLIDDPLDDFTVDGVQITVRQPQAFGIISPDADRTFLVSDAPLTIEYGINQGIDTLADLRIDPDDNHTNGNEITILSQRLIEAETERDTFVWNGNDSSGAAVPVGSYRLFVTIFGDGQQPRSDDSGGLIFRRAVEDQPVVAALEPATVQRVNAGQFVTIRWRDDDPDSVGTIRITIDDDPRPQENEPGSQTDLAEIEILSGRSAGGDGVQDTFSWQVPGSLAPDTYHVFVYITGNGQTQVSVAPASVIVLDPANP